MPLDTSTYHLAHLRLDGRRWNELRRMHAQISTQASADGSSYLEMGNTKVICTVAGPAEVRGAGMRSEGLPRGDDAVVTVEVGMAGFSGGERRKRGRGDRLLHHLRTTLTTTFQHTLLTHLHPHSTIALTLHLLATDGSLLAACLNAATLALIDAGIPMKDYVVACTSGLAPPSPYNPAKNTSGSGGEGDSDPLLDLNGQEEMELPFLTVGTLGAGERVEVCFLEGKVQAGRVEGMLAVGVDGCRQVRGILDGVVRERGRRVVLGTGGGKG